MTKQQSIFDQDPLEWLDEYLPKKEITPQKEYDYIENGKKLKHTPRQWKLYEFYKTHDLKGMTQEEIVKMHEDFVYIFDIDYGKYGFGFLSDDVKLATATRKYRKDKQALQKSETITVVITEYGIAHTEKEAQAFLNKSLIKILKMLKRYHKQNNKLNKHYQTRLVFNSEKDIIEAIKELENEI